MQAALLLTRASRTKSYCSIPRFAECWYYIRVRGSLGAFCAQFTDLQSSHSNRLSLKTVDYIGGPIVTFLVHSPCFIICLENFPSSNILINLHFYSVYTGCIKKKVIELQRAIIRESLGVWTIGFHIWKDQAFSYWMTCFSYQVKKK
jgi:hypothetical protein